MQCCCLRGVVARRNVNPPILSAIETDCIYAREYIWPPRSWVLIPQSMSFLPIQKINGIFSFCPFKILFWWGWSRRRWPIWFLLLAVSYGPITCLSAKDYHQLDPSLPYRSNPSQGMKKLMSQKGLPIPGEPFNASILERFQKVERDPNITKSMSTGEVKFFTNSWKEDFSCLEEKKMINIFGYRTNKCFGLDGYGSFLYDCDAGSSFSLLVLTRFLTRWKLYDLLQFHF
jgi:hypothetical protein